MSHPSRVQFDMPILERYLYSKISMATLLRDKGPDETHYEWLVDTISTLVRLELLTDTYTGTFPETTCLRIYRACLRNPKRVVSMVKLLLKNYEESDSDDFDLDELD